MFGIFKKVRKLEEQIKYLKDKADEAEAKGAIAQLLNEAGVPINIGDYNISTKFPSAQNYYFDYDHRNALGEAKCFCYGRTAGIASIKTVKKRAPAKKKPLAKKKK